MCIATTRIDVEGLHLPTPPRTPPHPLTPPSSHIFSDPFRRSERSPLAIPREHIVSRRVSRPRSALTPITGLTSDRHVRPRQAEAVADTDRIRIRIRVSNANMAFLVSCQITCVDVTPGW